MFLKMLVKIENEINLASKTNRLNSIVLKLLFLFLFVNSSFQQRQSDKQSRGVIAANSDDSSNNKTNITNPLLDATTAMFHHVENTKTCGANLEKLNINLEPLWLLKFENQIKKTIKLTSSLNHLIRNLDEDSLKHTGRGSSFNNFNLTSNLINLHLIESHMLSSLTYFMFSNSNNKNSNIYSFDPFIKGYGVVLFDDDEKIKELKCLFINDENQKNKSCLAFNLNERGEDSYFSSNPFSQEILLNKNNNINKQEDSELIFNKVYTNGNDLNSADDSTRNCFSWLKNLKQNFEEFSKKYNNDANDKNNYRKTLDMFIKTNSKSLWCGPYYDCASSSSKSQSDWILLYSLPLFDDQDKKMKGAVLVKLKLTNLDINQCRNGDPVFANTHKCKPNSECIFTPKQTFASGNYKCKCLPGHISTNRNFSSYDGKILEKQYWLMKSMKNNSYNHDFDCIQCSGKDCCWLTNQDLSQFEKALSLMQTVEDEELVKEYGESNIFWHCRKYNMTLRSTVFIVQIVFVIVTISIAIIIFCFRQNKIIKHSMWVLLEIILFGAILLYSTVLIQFFEPSNNLCLSLPWFRELGFTIVYGILNLRLYKILIEFQSRKAHVVHLKDKDILKILFFIVICVLGYLTAWTLVDIDYANEGYSLLTNTSLKGFIQYPMCKIKWWDYFIEMAEFLFICVGFYLIYCTRTAPSEFNERKFISLVIYFEGFVSTFLYIIKHSIFTSIHPDTILALYFFRCHSTVTVMILFIFFTKLLFLFKHNTDGYCRNARLSTVDGNEVIINQDSIKFQIGNSNDCENGDVNEIDMQPEEIRIELKRLYTQLHVYKTKSIKVDNPHLQSANKRRVKKLRKLSVTMQKSLNKDLDSYQIKTPDESICSTNEPNLQQNSAVCSEDQNNSGLNGK